MIKLFNIDTHIFGDCQIHSTDDENVFTLTQENGKQWIARRDTHSRNNAWTLKTSNGALTTYCIKYQNQIDALIQEVLENRKS